MLDVQGNIDHVDFQVNGILFFKVEKGLSVTTRTASGTTLVKAGTSFSEQVTLKDISKTKSLVVAPIYPCTPWSLAQGRRRGATMRPTDRLAALLLTSSLELREDSLRKLLYLVSSPARPPTDEITDAVFLGGVDIVPDEIPWLR